MERKEFERSGRRWLVEATDRDGLFILYGRSAGEVWATATAADVVALLTGDSVQEGREESEYPIDMDVWGDILG